MILPILGEVAAAPAVDGGGAPLALRMRLASSTAPLRATVPLPVNGKDHA